MGKIGLESIRTSELDTITSVTDSYLVPIFTATNGTVKPKLVTVGNLNAGGVLDSNNIWSGTNGFDDTVSIGKSGTAGDIKIYPSTASKGYVTITADDQTGDTAVEVNVNAMGQATVVNLDDPGIAASHLLQSTAQVTIAEADTLSGLTSTTAELNKNDISAETETITTGAISVTKKITNLDTTAGATLYTLAAPDASMLGHVKVIHFLTDNGDATLTLTNVQGGSAATTCTWANAGEDLVLVGGVSKWDVVSEGGVVLS